MIFLTDGFAPKTQTIAFARSTIFFKTAHVFVKVLIDSRSASSKIGGAFDDPLRPPSVLLLIASIVHLSPLPFLLLVIFFLLLFIIGIILLQLFISISTCRMKHALEIEVVVT